MRTLNTVQDCVNQQTQQCGFSSLKMSMNLLQKRGQILVTALARVKLAVDLFTLFPAIIQSIDMDASRFGQQA